MAPPAPLAPRHPRHPVLGEDYRPSDNFFGAPVVVSECEESFRVAFARALEAPGPTIIEAVVDPAEYDEVV